MRKQEEYFFLFYFPLSKLSELLDMKLDNMKNQYEIC